MGRLSAISRAKVNSGGVYFTEGVYLVEIKRVFLKNSRKGDDTFIVEGEILESSSPTREPGSIASHVMNLTRHDAAWGNMKAFLASSQGISNPDTYVPEDGSDADQFWEDLAETAIDEENPLEGTVMPLQCTVIKTRDNKDFTLHRWGLAREE